MVNMVIIQGRLVRDPEMVTTASGVSMCTFTVVHSKVVKGSDIVCFLNCTAWRHTADFVDNYFSKGKEIVVVGSLETRKYTDKSGNPRSSLSCNVNEVHFAGPKDTPSDDEPRGFDADTAGKEAASEEDYINIEFGDDDMPF